jgi:hypothetical protein
VKWIELKRTQTVCAEKERNREKERKNREKTQFFPIFVSHINYFPPKKKNALVPWFQGRGALSPWYQGSHLRK